MYLFDMDGTLIDSNGIWKDVDETFLSRRGFPYTKEYYEGVAHTIFPLAAKFTKEFCHLDESLDAIMAEWMELAKDKYAHVALKPHVRELLDALRARGERMVVFTSAVPVHCETALRAHGLMQYFDRLLFAQDYGMDKSNPEIFRAVAETLAIDPSECILIDDSIKSCRNAKSVGMTAYGVYDKYFEDDRVEMPRVCDRFVMNLSELL